MAYIEAEMNEHEAHRINEREKELAQTRLKNQVVKAKIVEKELIIMVVRMAKESMEPIHYENFVKAMDCMAENRQLDLQDIL